MIGKLPYNLRLTATIELSSGVRMIASPSHPVEMRLDGPRAVVTLAGDEVQLDRDFILNIEPQDAARPMIRFARDDEGYVAMLSFMPDIRSGDNQPVEVIFLLDRSGSMQGSSIDQARKALLLCLNSLRPGDQFNVIGFGSTYECLFPKNVPYSQDYLESAVRTISSIGADLGGTEILPPLQKALTMRGALPLQIIVITGGEFGNENQLIQLCRKHRGTCRIFTVGIGMGVNEFALRAIARASDGAAELIHPNERIEYPQYSASSTASASTASAQSGSTGTPGVTG